MADRRSRWRLVISPEPNGLSRADREHIAAQVLAGSTEGELAQDPPADADSLVWENDGRYGSRDWHADSRHVAPEATYAYYSLSSVLTAPGEEGRRWDLELIQINNGAEVDKMDLGRHLDEQIAKRHAQHWERHGTAPAPEPQLGETYVKGDRVELVHIADKTTGLEPGDHGTVHYANDLSTVVDVLWDGDSLTYEHHHLGVGPDQDRITHVATPAPPKPLSPPERQHR